ncbi:hypothetical protein ACJJTC_002800 [Scirpophaga incertulas]
MYQLSARGADRIFSRKLFRCTLQWSGCFSGEVGISLFLRVWIYLPETYAMNPASEDRDDVSDVASPPLASTSEVGYAQVPLSQNPSSSGDQWRAMFELQQQNMIKLIEAMKTPSVPVTMLPEFNPDSKDADARA